MADEGDPPIAQLEGHASAITVVTLYGRGARAIGASHDGTAIVWDVASGAPPLHTPLIIWLWLALMFWCLIS